MHDIKNETHQAKENHLHYESWTQLKGLHSLHVWDSNMWMCTIVLTTINGMCISKENGGPRFSSKHPSWATHKVWFERQVLNF